MDRARRRRTSVRLSDYTLDFLLRTRDASLMRPPSTAIGAVNAAEVAYAYVFKSAAARFHAYRCQTW